MSMNDKQAAAPAEEVALEVVEPSGNKAAIELCWTDVRYEVELKNGEKKVILQGLSGTAKPGEMLAIMGSSGAGKSTLITSLQKLALNPGKTPGLSGKLTMNGCQCEPGVFRSNSAYIRQEDVMIETMTPRELFNFSARMRLPPSATAEDRHRAVEHTISVLGLEKCADTRVGGVLHRGISGGERKRTNIGQELVTDPTVLFVDEPTSGLDSSTAEHVVQNLKKLALSGKTVICTIHQPSSDVYKAFDKLLLLSEGRTAYYGPAMEVVDFLSGLGHVCPQYYNPADYFMKIVEVRKPEDKPRVDAIVKALPEYQAAHNISILSSKDESSSSQKALFPKRVRIPFYIEFFALCQRAFMNFSRHKVMLFARLGQNIFMGLLTGTLFFNITRDQRGIQDLQGALFFIAVINAMTAILTTVLSFPPEKAVFLREHANNMYSVYSYFIGKSIAELPFQFIFPTINTSICYFMIGFQSSATKFFNFLLAAILMSLSGQSYGLLLGCAVQDATVAVALTPVAIVPLMLFAGFFVNQSNIPVWLEWIKYISPFKYGFDALAYSELSGSSFHFVGDPSRIFITGDEQLKILGIDKNDFVRAYWLMFTLFIGVRILALLLLKRSTKTQFN